MQLDFLDRRSSVFMSLPFMQCAGAGAMANLQADGCTRIEASPLLTAVFFSRKHGSPHSAKINAAFEDSMLSLS